MRVRSIRRTLVLSITLATAIVAVGAFALALFVIERRLMQDFDANLRLKAEAIASLIELDDDELELDERDQALGEFASRRNPSYFEVRAVGARTIERSLSLRAPLAIEVPIDARFHVEPLQLPDGRDGRVGVLPIVLHDDDDDDDPRPARDPAPGETPAAWVLVAAGTQDVVAAINDVRVVLLASLGTIAAAVALLTPALVGLGLRPLRALSDRAARLDANNLAERFPTRDLPAELAPIATQLNASLDRIGSAFERERRFASNAAHELRTPLTAIRTNADVALRWPDPQRAQRSLVQIASSAARMQALIERLMELTRLGGSGSTTLAREALDLHRLVTTSLEAQASTIARRALTVAVELPPGTMIHTDAHLLQPLLDNLIANAAQHADPETRVRIDGDATRLTIVNRASDLAANDLQHLAEPLWTRSTDRSLGNAGLGLPLVAEYARHLGARVEPELSTDGWFRQTVYLPGA